MFPDIEGKGERTEGIEILSPKNLTVLRARTERAPQAKHFMFDSAGGERRIEQ
jgi:hypothetical protein